MKNIIKAQLYQISKMRVLRLVALGGASLCILIGLVEKLNGADALDEGYLMTASDYCTRCRGNTIFVVLFMSIVTAFICADDFADKTANHEILSGTLRWQSYFARAGLAVVISTLFGQLMIAASVVTYTLACGWGDTITVGTALARLLLTALPFMRLNCFFVLAAFIFKKTFWVPILAFVAQTVCGLLKVGGRSSYLTSIGTLNRVLHFEKWYTFGLRNGSRIIYEHAPDSRTVMLTIVSSIFFVVLYLAIGCSLYHGDDLN